MKEMSFKGFIIFVMIGIAISTVFAFTANAELLEIGGKVNLTPNLSQTNGTLNYTRIFYLNNFTQYYLNISHDLIKTNETYNITANFNATILNVTFEPWNNTFVGNLSHNQTLVNITILNSTWGNWTEGLFNFNITVYRSDGNNSNATFENYINLTSRAPIMTSSGYTEINLTGYETATVNFTLDISHVFGGGVNQTAEYNFTANNNGNFTVTFTPNNVTVRNNSANSTNVSIVISPIADNASIAFNITANRTTDNKQFNFTVNVTVTNASAILEYYTLTDWVTSGTTESAFTKIFVINNTGSWNATDCNVSIIAGGGVGFLDSFFSHNAGVNFSINNVTSVSFEGVLSAVTAGTYTDEYVEVTCKNATAQNGSVKTTLNPKITLTTSVPVPSPGGGGTITTYGFCGDGVCDTGENITNCYTDCAGITWYFIPQYRSLSIVPGSCSEKDFVIANNASKSLLVTVKLIEYGDGSTNWAVLRTSGSTAYAKEITLNVSAGAEHFPGNTQFFVKMCVPSNQTEKLYKFDIESSTINGKVRSPMQLTVSKFPSLYDTLAVSSTWLVTAQATFPNLSFLSIVFVPMFWIGIAAVVGLYFRFFKK